MKPEGDILGAIIFVPTVLFPLSTVERKKRKTLHKNAASLCPLGKKTRASFTTHHIGEALAPPPPSPLLYSDPSGNVFGAKVGLSKYIFVSLLATVNRQHCHFSSTFPRVSTLNPR